jgi:hypothetical protein
VLRGGGREGSGLHGKMNKKTRNGGIQPPHTKSSVQATSIDVEKNLRERNKGEMVRLLMLMLRCRRLVDGRK